MRNPMRLAFLATLLLSGCGESHPRVVMDTGLGEITLEIYTAEAPLTANFLRHVEQSSFDGATFYRTVHMGNQPDNDIKIEVIQGGIGDRADDIEPIAHEVKGAIDDLHHHKGDPAIDGRHPEDPPAAELGNEGGKS